MKITPGNAQHIGDRAEQQDAFGFTDLADTAFVAHGGALAALADGMGGMAMGREAAQAAIDALLAAYAAKEPTTPIPEAMLTALYRANEAVRAIAREAGLEDASVGTTLVAAVVHEDALYWVAVGDSRLYLLRDGELTQLNEEHTYARDLLRQVAAGTLSRAEAASHPDRDVLTSHLGMAGPPEVDHTLRPLRLRPGDRVLLCSDGVYRSLSDARIAEIVATGEPQVAAEGLISLALDQRQPHQDNLTAVMLAGKDTPPPTSPSAGSPRRVRGWLLWVFGLVCGVAFYHHYSDALPTVWERLWGSIQGSGTPVLEAPEHSLNSDAIEDTVIGPEPTREESADSLWETTGSEAQDQSSSASLEGASNAPAGSSPDDLAVPATGVTP